MNPGLAEQRVPPHANVCEFGTFRYDTSRCELSDAHGVVRAGSRSLQLLTALLQEPGRLYSREELVSRVWPNTVVEETSLRVHISALRRLIDDGHAGAKFITTVSGRGYAFTGEVRTVSVEPVPVTPLSASAAACRHVIPPRLTKPVGRGSDIAKIGELLSRERLVSIVGAGGMGKTTVALAVAEHQAPMQRQGAIFVDLSTLVDAELVVVEVGRCCGLDVGLGETWVALEGLLHKQQLLIILDNCEHLIDAAAAFADRLLRTCPEVRILATSREPLEAEAEWVFRLPPLGVPEPEATLAIDQVLSFTAVQLFVERAQAASHAFELAEDNVWAVRQLCSFLDGIPLAIELAAARINGLGVNGVLSRLEHALDLLTRGRRTAMSRHQTLHALMNWSYQLLTDTEKQVLQRLSVFRSSFDLDSASAVVACEKLPGHQVVDSVLSLCEKSLLVRDAGDRQGLRYRLLYMTRLFAERELALGSDAFEVHHRHAAFVLNSYAQHEDDGRSRSATYRKNFLRVPMYADLRSAVTWALLDENDLKLGMQIMADSACVHLAGHATYEARKNLDAAIDKLERAGAKGTALELKLRTNLTFAFAQGIVGREELDRALSMTRTLANDLGSPQEKIEALYATCTGLYGHGRYLEALAHCDEIRERAQGELAKVSTALGDRLAVLNLHALGQHDAAERLAHRVLLIDDKALPWRFQSTVPFAVSMRIQLARIHWLRGEFLQAWSTIHEAIKLDDGSHLQIKCQLLGMAAIPIAIWKGDVPTATRWVRELLENSTHANIPYWHGFATAYRDMLAGHTALPHELKRHFPEESAPLMDICATL